MPCLAGVHLADALRKCGDTSLKRCQEGNEAVCFIIIGMTDDDRPEMDRAFHKSAGEQLIRCERTGEQFVNIGFHGDVSIRVRKYDLHIA